MSKSIETTYTSHLISAPWRSSGKSMLSMGLARAATRRSIGVQTFKKGPDYIDPLWLKAASGLPTYNLDPYLQNEDELLSTYFEHMNEMMLLEGTMGLHDGLALDGSDSNAAIAKRLGAPVLLVVDCRGMHRTIAALVNGMVQFDPELKFSGLVLNRIRSARHASKIERAIRQYCDIELLGVVPEVAQLQIDERELGLVPAPDHPEANRCIDTVADLLETSCNLDRLFEHNNTHSLSASSNSSVSSLNHTTKDNTTACNYSLNIAIAQDEAFHFYYEDDLDNMRSRGIKLVPFSPMRDPFPSNVDGVLIGGGFPERHAAALSDNAGCRHSLANAVAKGLPVRAECGGLMYLAQSIEINKVVWPMVGAFDGSVTMHAKPRGRGYMNLTTNPAFARSSGVPNTLKAHEFHHSAISFDTPPNYAYRVTRGHGVDAHNDGVCVHNVVASYAHFRHTEATPWIDWFIDSIHRSKQDAMKTINHV